jgi:beta-galactosidase/beta-glucuronidase
MRLTLVFVCAAVVVGAIAAPAASAQQISPANPRPVVHDGPTGRYMLDGLWLLRVDRSDRGAGQHWERRRSTAGWSPITIPNAWNANDPTSRGFIGAPAWYRRDFRLPSRAKGLAWTVRFDAVNYRATVWLNGRLVGHHAGGFIPFSLPLSALNRGGVNRLVVRVDNRRLPTDFPPTTFTRVNEPRGGWWNYGGIVREVYLQRIDRVAFDRVVVRPSVPCPTCRVTVRLITVVRNVSGRSRRVRVRANFGGLPVNMGIVDIHPGSRRTLTRRIPVSSPHLWTPTTPFLYPVAFSATSGSGVAARYLLHTGLRSVSVRADGRLLLNGLPVNLRGVAVHDDLPGKGAALSEADRVQLIGQIKDSGSTLVRSHYPLSPAFEELADQAGLLIWSEVPVYRMNTGYLFASTRRAAVDLVRTNVLDNENHPSVMIWSIANELKDTLPPRVRSYIRAATRVAKGLDPSRPVGMAIEGHPLAGCQAAYEPLDVLGLNDYFGWYDGQVANRDELSPYLDRMRACLPRKALIVTEFGAEANRFGSPLEKGTYEFQQDFLKFHLGVFATKPWLSGAVYFPLREFLVRPGWDGGNPVPNPPFHQKAVISYNGVAKPAYYDMQAAFRATQQYPSAAP